LNELTLQATFAGLLHDIDFEMWPEQHCRKAPELLKKAGCSDEFIHAVCSHGYGLCCDVEPTHEMEKVLFAADELTGLVGAAARMRPSKSVMDMEVSSLKKKYKDKKFAAGCSRDVINTGAERLGWTIEELMEKTILAMRSCEESVNKEMETLRAAGVIITPENLKVSDRASLLLPWHRELDALEEARLADKKYGSTKQGIAPFYGDKYQKKTVQAGELLHPEHLKEHLADLLEWKNLMLQKIYGAKGYTMDELMAWVNTYCGAIKPYITDTGRFLRNAQKEGKSILFEAQLGALRDLDYGIYPYTTSSNAVAAYAPVGSGLPAAKLDEVVGVVKAYSSCVGEGPFVCEWFGEGAQQLRDAGAEYGAKTGRPRRVGPIDLVATRNGVETQGATNIALTKLDVLSYMDKIPVCAHYELNGEQTDDFPFPVLLQDAKPVVEYLPGWQCDISGARNWEDLPEAARSYVEYVEKAIGCHIGFVSVGAERESLIIR